MVIYKKHIFPKFFAFVNQVLYKQFGQKITTLSPENDEIWSSFKKYLTRTKYPIIYNIRRLKFAIIKNPDGTYQKRSNVLTASGFRNRYLPFSQLSQRMTIAVKLNMPNNWELNPVKQSLWALNLIYWIYSSLWKKRRLVVRGFNLDSISLKN